MLFFIAFQRLLGQTSDQCKKQSKSILFRFYILPVSGQDGNGQRFADKYNAYNAAPPEEI